MIEYQVECILNPDNKNYRSNIKRQITSKNNYKTAEDRNTIFEQNNTDT